MSRSALVTGASGFVASRLVARLLDGGWRVSAAVRPTSSLALLPTGHPALTVRSVRPGSDDLADALAEVEAATVFHLASHYVTEHRTADIDALVDANIAYGAHLLDAMARTGKTDLVAVSTVWLHRDGNPWEPVNLYAATKAAFERVLAYYVSAHGLRAVTVELGDTYGPGDPRGKLLDALVDAARTGRTLALSPGKQALDPAHVDDVTAGLELAAARAAAADPGSAERFTLLPGDPVTLRDLVAELEDAIGMPVPVEWGARPYREREVFRPSSPAPVLPGWHPAIPRRDGLRQLAPKPDAPQA